MDQNYEDHTVDQLQDELRERELPVSGNKDELIARLEANDVDNQPEPEPEPGPEEAPGPEEGTGAEDQTQGEANDQQAQSEGDTTFQDRMDAIQEPGPDAVEGSVQGDEEAPALQDNDIEGTLGSPTDNVAGATVPAGGVPTGAAVGTPAQSDPDLVPEEDEPQSETFQDRINAAREADGTETDEPEEAVETPRQMAGNIPTVSGVPAQMLPENQDPENRHTVNERGVVIDEGENTEGEDSQDE